MGFTNAITIDAPPEQVWPWVIQMGYKRAGWYNIDWVNEKLGGPGYFYQGAHESANRIIPELQNVGVGDTISLAEGIDFTVFAVEPPNQLLIYAGQKQPAEWSPDTWSESGDEGADGTSGATEWEEGADQGSGEATDATSGATEWENEADQSDGSSDASSEAAEGAPLTAMSWLFRIERTPEGNSRLISRVRSKADGVIGYVFGLMFNDMGAFFQNRAMLKGIKERVETET
jgi:hypothetical protein